MAQTWTQQRTALLKRLWADGLSTSQIASRLGGVTRNAVIGKVTRLGLCGRGLTSRKRTDRARQPSTAVRRPTAIAALYASRAPTIEDRAPCERLLAAAVDARRITMVDLEPHHCRFPLWSSDADPRHYCGKANVTGLPWCEAHALIVYASPPVSLRAASPPAPRDNAPAVSSVAAGASRSLETA